MTLQNVRRVHPGLVAIALFTVGACHTSVAPRPTPTVVSGLSFAPHSLELSDGRKVAAELAWLRVPERRSLPAGKMIELPVLRLRSNSATPGTPIVYLPGNPGGASGTGTVAVASLFPFFDGLRALSDVVVIDYRGSGMSRPRLDCPAGRITADAFANRASFLALVMESSKRCAEARSSLGDDIRGYTWGEIASDIADLRVALGVPRISLVAFSSGTHAALAVLRRHPGVERVVMIGTEGPDHTRKLPSNIDRQIALIGALVQQDSTLRADIADFPGLVRRVLDTMTKAPVEVEVTLPGSPDKVRGRIGAFGMQFLTAKSLAGPEEFGTLPLLYHSVSRGDVSVLTRMVQRMAQRPPANALTYVLDGASGVSDARWAQIEREASISALGNAVNFPFPEIVSSWGYEDLGAGFRSDVSSRVPALFVTGMLDGNTPPHQADAVQAGFANGSRLRIANGGHGSAFTTPAAWSVIHEFIRSGRAVDTTVTAPRQRFAPLRR